MAEQMIFNKLILRMNSILDYTICHRLGKIPFGYNKYQRGKGPSTSIPDGYYWKIYPIKVLYLIGNSD